mmetsp:Transcript_18989/g.44276  ORF Transcript_18989/g.44276 Transcript_18989/m.44276 type:complete len:410 (-) Transcript_18989:18-1247(-)
MKIAVVGGSVGGLAVGNLLRQLGHEVHIFERSSALRGEIGGGIVVQPPLEKLFAKLGLGKPPSVGMLGRQFLDKTDHSQTQRAPQDMTSWSGLWQPLRDAFGNTNFHDGCMVSGVQRLEGNDHQLQIQVQNPNASEDVPTVFDLVIAADGSNSLLRRALVTAGRLQNTPCYAGYVAWRGVVPPHRLAPEVVDKLRSWFTFFHGPHTHILVYEIPMMSVEGGEPRLNWVWYWNVDDVELKEFLRAPDEEASRQRFSVPPGQLNGMAQEKLMTLARTVLPESLRLLVEATEEPFMQPIYDYTAEQAVFEDGHLVLMGDAQCVIRPHTAYGTAKAAEDAMAISAALPHGQDWQVSRQRLKEWEQRALLRNAQFSEYGAHLGASQHKGTDGEQSIHRTGARIEQADDLLTQCQ